MLGSQHLRVLLGPSVGLGGKRRAKVLRGHVRLDQAAGAVESKQTPYCPLERGMEEGREGGMEEGRRCIHCPRPDDRS